MEITSKYSSTVQIQDHFNPDTIS